jgi:hypothetical protein
MLSICGEKKAVKLAALSRTAMLKPKLEHPNAL